MKYNYFSFCKVATDTEMSYQNDFARNLKGQQMQKPHIIFSHFKTFNSIISYKLSGALSPHWNGNYIKSKNTQHPSHDGHWIKTTAPRFNSESLKSNQDETLMKPIKTNREIFYVLTSQIFDILYVGVTAKGFEEGLLGQNGRFHHHIKKFLAIKGASTNHTKGWHHHAFERYQFSIQEKLETSVFLDDLMISLGSFEEPENYCAEDFEGFVLSSAFSVLNGTQGTRVLNTGALQYRPAEINFQRWFD